MSDFVSGFWNVWIITIVLGGIAFCGLLLWTQMRAKHTPGQVTGHVWDENLEEYNNPMPGWWRWMFVLTIVFSLVYLAMYPGLGTYAGSYQWTSVGQYEKEKSAAEEQFKAAYADILAQSVEQAAFDPKAREGGERLFMTYCSQCHGSDAKGAKGFPNLTDEDWLFGGNPDQIKETLTNGRQAMMPAFGHLGGESIKDVAAYVRSLSGVVTAESIRAQRGKAVFASAGCAACHGPEGKGNLGVAPNLSDKVWLYGGSENTVIETITNGRANTMPAFGEFLGQDKVHLLTAYVYGLSAKQNK